MEIGYTDRQYETAGRDIEEIYDLAEGKVGAGCYPISREAMINAFQVFRYALREWAETKEVGVVLRALMYRENRSREVTHISQKEEMAIYCEDKAMAEAIERILLKDGYEENSK